MEEFNAFLQNNYYGILPYETYYQLFDEWLSNPINEEKAMDFAVDNGYDFMDDIMIGTDFPETDSVISTIQDLSEYAEPFFMAEAYYCYVINCAKETLRKQLKTKGN